MFTVSKSKVGKKTEKALVIVLSALIICTMLPLATLAASFSDMPNNWSTVALQSAVDNGLLQGVSGNLLPENDLTRAEMAAIVNRAFGASVQSSLSAFSDVGAGKWYAADMAKAVHMKTFVGSNGKLNPDSFITREEAFTVLARAMKMNDGSLDALNKFSDVNEVSSWAKGPLAAMTAAGYINGSDGKLNPKAYVTRAQFAQTMYNTIKTYVSTASTVTAVPTGNVMINVPEVTLSDLTVNGDLIIGDGAGSGNITLKNTKVTGRLVIRGGGVNSIHISGDSTIGTVIIAKVDGQVRLVTEDGSVIPAIYIDDGNDDVVISGTVGTIKVTASDVPVVLQNATVQDIDIAASGISVSASGTTTVANASVSANNVSFNVPNTLLTVAGGVTGTTAGGSDIPGGTTGTTQTGGGVATTPPAVGGGGGGGFTTVNVTGISLNNTTLTLTAGGATSTLVATVAPANATNKNVTWSSNDTAVATVDENGLVAPVAAGTATITVSTADGNKTATCTVTVNSVSTINVTTYNDLKSALENQSYTTIYLDGDVTIPQGDTLTIPSGKTLVLNNKITVSDGAALINNGDIETPSTDFINSIAYKPSRYASNLTDGLLFVPVKLGTKVKNAAPVFLASNAQNNSKIEIQGSGMLKANPNSNIHFNSFSDIITPSQDSLLLYAGAKVKVGDKQYLGDNNGNAIIQLSNFDGSTAPVAGWFLNGDGKLLLVIFEKATILKPDANILDIYLLVKAGENGNAPGELDIPNFGVINSASGAIDIESNGNLVVNGTSIMSKNNPLSVFNATGGDTDNRRGVSFMKFETQIAVTIYGDVTMNKALIVDAGLTPTVSPDYSPYNSFYGEDLHATLNVMFTPNADDLTGYPWEAPGSALANGTFSEDSSQHWVNVSDKAALAAVALEKINGVVGGDASSITWGDLYDTGAVNVIIDNLAAYQMAISSATSPYSFDAIQILINNVNLAPYIAKINNAAGNDILASQITIGDLTDAGAVNTNYNYLSNYQSAIAAAASGSLNTTAAIQALIDTTNAIVKISYAAGDGILSNQITIGDLTTTGAINVNADCLAAYQAVIGNATSLDTLAKIQAAIDTANNALANIAAAAGDSDLAANISCDDLYYAGIKNYSTDNIAAFQAAIASASPGSLGTIVAIQALIDAAD